MIDRVQPLRARVRGGLGALVRQSSDTIIHTGRCAATFRARPAHLHRVAGQESSEYGAREEESGRVGLRRKDEDGWEHEHTICKIEGRATALSFSSVRVPMQK